MTIGEVAIRAGIHTSAIRYYEKAGLLMPPARTSGRRVYQQEVVHQLTIISVYKDLGFSLQEIGLLLNELPKDKSASARWSELAQAKIKEMENVVAKATAVKKTLRAIMQCGCTKLEDCARGFVQSPRRKNSLHVPLPTGPIAGLKNMKPASEAPEYLKFGDGRQDIRRKKEMIGSSR
jgi:MerR family redox-sensitive transcriptional activator SoxR